MSVIGRLDEQTDAILISPLKKRAGRQPDAASAQDERANDRAETSSQTQSPISGGDEIPKRGPSVKDELPIWLL